MQHVFNIHYHCLPNALMKQDMLVGWKIYYTKGFIRYYDSFVLVTVLDIGLGVFSTYSKVSPQILNKESVKKKPMKSPN